MAWLNCSINRTRSDQSTIILNQSSRNESIVCLLRSPFFPFSNCLQIYNNRQQKFKCFSLRGTLVTHLIKQSYCLWLTGLDARYCHSPLSRRGEESGPKMSGKSSLDQLHSTYRLCQNRRWVPSSATLDRLWKLLVPQCREQQPFLFSKQSWTPARGILSLKSQLVNRWAFSPIHCFNVPPGTTRERMI